MHETDAQQAAGFLHAEALGQIQGIVVAVPSKDAAIAEKFGAFERRASGEAHSDGRNAFGEARWIRNAVETQAGNGEQAANHLGGEVHFVFAHGAMGGKEGGTARWCGRVALSSERGHV